MNFLSTDYTDYTDFFLGDDFVLGWIVHQATWILECFSLFGKQNEHAYQYESHRSGRNEARQESV